jgi:hypothetical protein
MKQPAITSPPNEGVTTLPNLSPPKDLPTAVKLILAFIAIIYVAVFLSGLPAYIAGEPGGFSVLYNIGHQVRVNGLSGLYDQRIQEIFHPGGRGGGYFYHLPYEIGILLPLSLLSQRAAFLLWTAFNLACIVVGNNMLWRRNPLAGTLAALAFAPTLAMCVNGQDSGLVFLLITSSMLQFSSRHEHKAAMLLALALFKFQYVIPLALVLCWRHRAFAKTFCVACATVILLSWALVGNSGVRDYINLVTSNSDMGLMMPNLRGLVEGSSGGAHPFAVVVLSALLIAWAAKSSSDDRSQGIAAATLVAYLTSYHGHFYDALLLLIPIAIYLRNAKTNLDLWPAALILLSPILLLNPLHIYLLAVPLLALLLTVARTPGDVLTTIGALQVTS